MNLTNFNAPPYRVILTVISIVVGLHVLTAVAIVMVKPPASIIEEEVTPPIEIQLIPAPDETVELANEKSVAESVKSVTETPEQSKPKNKPKSAVNTETPKAKTQKTESTKSSIKSQVNNKPDVNKATKKDPIVKKQLEPKDDTAESNKNIDLKAEQQAALQAEQKANEQREVLAAQAQQREAELAKLEAQKAAQAQREAQVAANAQAARDAAEKAAQQAKEAAAEKAAVQAASNHPVDYGNIGKASWQKEPVFDSIKNKKYRFGTLEAKIKVSFSVDAKGRIGSVNIIQSSGNNNFDKDFIRALLKARLHPVTRDDSPVKSEAILPFRMKL